MAGNIVINKITLGKVTIGPPPPGTPTNYVDNTYWEIWPVNNRGAWSVDRWVTDWKDDLNQLKISPIGTWIEGLRPTSLTLVINHQLTDLGIGIYVRDTDNNTIGEWAPFPVSEAGQIEVPIPLTFVTTDIGLISITDWQYFEAKTLELIGIYFNGI